MYNSMIASIKLANEYLELKLSTEDEFDFFVNEWHKNVTVFFIC